MIVQRADQLPKFGPRDTFILDVETTSWDDDTKALNPWAGHQICGIALASEDGQQTWYLPIRYHDTDTTPELFNPDFKNLDLFMVRRFLRDLLGCATRSWVNHNIKFDGRFLHRDQVEVSCQMEDTLVLARLVDHGRDKAEGRRGYTLTALCEDFVGISTSSPGLTEFLKVRRTKDFGRVPIHIIAAYSENQVQGTALLRRTLLKLLPPISQEVWKTEKRLSYWLLKSEIHGVTVRKQAIQETYTMVLKQLIKKLEEAEQLAGHEVILSNACLTKTLWKELGIEPRAWTSGGKKKIKKPQWNATVLEILGHPIGPILAEASHLQHFASTFCEGWLKRLAPDGRLHANFKQGGTATGRLSCTDPNLEQIPVEAEPFIYAREGYGLIYADYSQMEYRFFGHYTDDPAIVAAYRTSVDADFHQILADMLGVDRQFAKQLNFSFLYGMGKNTLLKSLAAVLALAAVKGDEKINERLRVLLTGGGQQTKERAQALDTSEQMAAAEKIYVQYHRQFPSIRRFQRRVKQALDNHGYIRNYYGRVYAGLSSHKGPNYLIQGSCADLFKAKIVDLCEKYHQKYGIIVLDVIHDSVLMECPLDTLSEFFLQGRQVLEETDLKVPMYVKGMVSRLSWGQMVKVPRNATISRVQEALDESPKQVLRAWGT